MLLYQWLKFRQSLGDHHLITRVAEIFVADKLYISTKLGVAHLKFQIVLHVYIEQFLT